MSKEAKWIIGILVVAAIAMMGGQLAAFFIGVPVGLAIFFAVLMGVNRALDLDNDRDNPWKLIVWCVAILLTVFFVWWLWSLTGWWD